MSYLRRYLFTGVLLVAGMSSIGSVFRCRAVLAAQGSQSPSLDFGGGETLKLKLLWPSGVSLGEAVFVSAPTEKNKLRFELTVEADLPGHDIVESYTSLAARDTLCSLQFQKKGKEGARTSEETLEFDQSAHQVSKTSGGKTTVLPAPGCARDPLTFFYYFRKQLAAGNPVNQATFYPAPGYGLDLKPSGVQTISAGGRQRRAEKYLVTYSGPNSSKTFELWVSAEARREPLLVRLPFPLAIFSAELQ